MPQDNENQKPQEGSAPEEPREEVPHPQPEPPATPGDEGAGAPVMNAEEIEEGKAMAVLSYVLSLAGLPFFIIPLIMRNNDFALYHAKQCLMIWIVGIVGSAIGGILTVICIGVIVLLAVGIYLLVITIMGIINSAKGEAIPLPLIGSYAEEWFKGITKA